MARRLVTSRSTKLLTETRDCICELRGGSTGKSMSYHDWKEVDMKHLLACMVLATLRVAALAADCPQQSKDANELIKTEQAWAKALDTHNTDAVACILAEGFQDADTSGQLHDRNAALARVPKRRPGQENLTELDPHVLGDYGYVRGLATLTDPQGKTVARVRFTDIFAYRDGRWVALAGQETLLAETK